MDLGATFIILIFSSFFVAAFVLMLVVVSKVFKISKDLEESSDFKRGRSRKIGKNIEKKLDIEISKILASFEATINSEVKRHLEKLAEDAEQKNEQMTKFIEDQQAAVVKESQFLIANSLQKISKELEVYRATRTREIDDQIRQIILSAAREVLGRSISLAEHEQLVREALEKAKKDKLFS